MAHIPDRAIENPKYSEIDEGIQRLRNLQSRNDEARPSRRVTYSGDQRKNALIRKLLQEIRELRLQLIGPPGNEHANCDGRRREILEQFCHPLNLTYGRTHEDVCNQPGSSFGFFDIKRNEKYDTGI